MDLGRDVWALELKVSRSVRGPRSAWPAVVRRGSGRVTGRWCCAWAMFPAGSRASTCCRRQGGLRAMGLQFRSCLTVWSTAKRVDNADAAIHPVVLEVFGQELIHGVVLGMR